MAKVLIRSPKDGVPVMTKHDDATGTIHRWFFVASGHANPSIVNVTGAITLPGSIAIEGTTLSYRWNAQKKRFHWNIFFQVDVGDEGNYQLDVTGFDGGGKNWPADPITVPIGNAFGPSTIAWPDENENISNYKDDFTPYGDLRAAINTLTLKYPSPGYANSVNSIYIYQDYTDQFIWVGQFTGLELGKQFELKLIDAKTPAPTTVIVHPKTY